MKLLTGDNLELYIRLFNHDTGNNLLTTQIFLEQAQETGNKEFIKKAQLAVEHIMMIKNASTTLITENIEKDSWLKDSDSLNIGNIVNTAIYIAEDHRDTYHPQMQVSTKVDDVNIRSNELFYKYFYNCISNSFKSLRKKAYHTGDEKRPFGYDDFSFGPRLDIICEKSEGEAKIVLRDNGLGMSEEQIKNVGKIGYSNWQDGRLSSGFGLAFMDIVLPKVGVRYKIESKPGEYAQFTFYAAIKK
jgi:hypothetical protein